MILRHILRFGRSTALCAALLGLCSAAPTAGSKTDRIEVNALEYPWSAIGRVNAGGRGHCTGVLIGERTVLTASHCLFDPIEGRWRAASEIHFVAGYQRDTYLIHSAVARYERSSDFDMGAGATPKNAVADWALLTLEQPIGRAAGWLGLSRLNGEQLRRGALRAVQAGYRQGRSHIMSVSLDCALSGVFGGGRGIAHSCAVFKGDSGSPLLVFEQSAFRIAGIHVLNASEDGRAGAFAATVFEVGTGVGQAVAALRRNGIGWPHGQVPAPGGPAEPVPLSTIDRLLSDLGHLPSAPARDAAQRRDAIAAFQAATGLRADGEASVALLGSLIQAMR